MSQFNQQDVEIIESTEVYSGYFKMYRYQLRHQLFSGGWSQILTREILERGAAVAVLLYDPTHDKVVLIEQLRAGAIKTAKPWLIEVVAGMIEHGETPNAVAHREAREETNLTIQQLIPIYNYWVSPGGSTERLSLYCGLIDATQANDSNICGLAHEHEDIRTLVLTRTAAFAMLETGEIDNAFTIIALQWLQLNYQQLKSTSCHEF